MEHSIATPGWYGQHFIENTQNMVNDLKRLNIALEGIEPEVFEAVFRLGYEAATSSIPLEGALAQQLVQSKKV
jgi:hypothetical protein